MMWFYVCREFRTSKLVDVKPLWKDEDFFASFGSSIINSPLTLECKESVDGELAISRDPFLGVPGLFGSCTNGSVMPSWKNSGVKEDGPKRLFFRFSDVGRRSWDNCLTTFGRSRLDGSVDSLAKSGNVESSFLRRKRCDDGFRVELHNPLQEVIEAVLNIECSASVDLAIYWKTNVWHTMRGKSKIS